jgi:outer membrane protein insertion porin family
VVPFKDKDEDKDGLQLFDKLFIGGGRTIRGYDFRDVGPKVVQFGDDNQVTDHRPIGGEALINGIIEYIVPVVDGLRLAAFVDAGNVYEEIDDVDLGELASSVGVELRLDVPGFPIRISYAVPLEKDDDLTDEDKVGFWIGN